LLQERSMQEAIDLYYWPTPNGWKVSIALEEMGLAYNVKLVDIGAGDQFDPDFLKISPNNRMPAIVDPDGPDGAPVSIFESGAILLYLARKTGRFYGETERDRIAVEEWLTWQIGGVGPMAGQAHHFLRYAPAMDPPQDLPYAKDRYRREVGRLYRVLDRRLADNRFVAGDFFSIADMAIWTWARGWERQEQSLEDKPHMARWLAEVGDRPAVQRGRALAGEKRRDIATDRAAQEVLFKHD
jgi:GST-like protein